MKELLSKKYSGLILLVFIVLFNSCKDDFKDYEDKHNSTTSKIYYDEHNDANEFKILGGKWNKSNISWFIADPSKDISLTTLKATIQKAFDTWGSVANIKFIEASNISSADIVLSWGNSSHSSWEDNSYCQTLFSNSVLAHAFGPPPNNYLTGDIHFWTAWKWTPNGEINGNSVSILAIAIHEIGHSLGLDHSLDENSIMFASYDPTNPKYTLSADDIAGVKSLYNNSNNGGSNTTYTDSRDGQTYKTVTIGNQIWMTENFRYNVSGSIVYNNDNSNLMTNGRLYNWQEALNSVPNGWRIPTDEDWKQLEIVQGMSPNQANYFGNDRYNPTVCTRLLIGGVSGLNLTLSGYFPIQWGFFDLNSHGYYWTSSTFSTNDGLKAMWERDITSTNINRVGMSTTTRISLRLIRE